MLDSTISRIVILAFLALIPYLAECRHFRPVWHHKRGGGDLEEDEGFFYPFKREVEERKRHFETPEEDEGGFRNMSIGTVMICLRSWIILYMKVPTPGKQ